MSPCALHIYTVSGLLTQSGRTYESHACLRSDKGKHRNKCRIHRVSAQDLNITIVDIDWPLQASILGLLFSYACYAERPRGWADSSFVEVHMGHSSLEQEDISHWPSCAKPAFLCSVADTTLPFDKSMLFLQVKGSVVHGRYACLSHLRSCLKGNGTMSSAQDLIPSFAVSANDWQQKYTQRMRSSSAGESSPKQRFQKGPY